MQQIAYFIRKYNYFLLFLLLEFISVALTIRSHSYHRSKFINSTYSITGKLLDISMSIFEYGHLKSDNFRLAEENAKLRTLMDTYSKGEIILDTAKIKNKFVAAKVIQNSYTKQNNVLTIDKGQSDGILEDMGVANSSGIIGIINNTSAKYATVLSVLNENSKINAKLKNNNYFGILTWNGKDHRYSQLLDIQRQANIKIGDTVVTGGKSIVFPENIPIGKIKKFDASNKNYSNIEIELFNDMSNLGFVYVIENIDKKEILDLRNND